MPVDEHRAKEIGYMGVYEWDGEDFSEREGDASSREPIQWVDENTREQWRQAFLAALATDHGGRDDKPFTCRERGAPHHKDLGEAGHPCECLECECLRASTAAFADSINTGYYVNSYTTKQCPTMEGVLENLRQGLERLEEQRAREEEELENKRARDAAALGREISEAELKAY